MGYEIVPFMKTKTQIKCPHCEFVFNPNEDIKPPFKTNQKVRFVKSQLERGDLFAIRPRTYKCPHIQISNQ